MLARNGTFVGLRKYHSRVGAFNRFLHANAETDDERELLAAKLVGPLAQRCTVDTRARSVTTQSSVLTPCGTTISHTPEINTWPADSTRCAHAAHESARDGEYALWP